MLRPLLPQLLAATAAALLGCSPAPEPPNVLLISVDTLRPDRLGCYGHARETSPTLDRLAAEGVLFEDVTSASPWTLPSHTSLFTGLYPSRHGVKDHVNRLRKGVPTLALLLRERGYATKAVINSHNLTKRYGLGRGFDDFEYVPEADDEGALPNRGPQIVARALRWLDQPREGPFFLFLHFYDVHTDLTPSEPYRERFVRPYEGGVDGTTQQLVDLRERGTALGADDVRYLFDLYDAEIRELDDLLGRLMSELDGRGLLEHTLIVVTSDHGEEFMEHGSVLHGRTYYEEVVRIPLVLWGPRVPAGVRVARPPVHLVDVAPTLLALAGAEQPAGLDGVDLAPFWRDPGAPPPDRLLFAEADHNNAEPDIRRMVRAPHHKLLYDRLHEEAQLYDIAADPGETTDLSETDPELFAFLLEQLRAFMSGEAERELIDAPDEATLRRLEELGY